MNEAMTTHPEPERLLQYVDCELGAVERKDVSRHLIECGDCKVWLSELESGIVDYSHTWMPMLKETAVAPPAQWFDLRQRMMDLDRGPSPVAPAIRFRPQWFAAAAAALFVAISAYWFSERTVSAAELLRKAADRESHAEEPRRPIRIRTRSGSMVRPALWRQSGQPRMSAADQAHAQSLRTLFEAGNYSWEEPLSARSFSAWRASLPDRQDQVVKGRGDDGANSIEIRTRTESGALAEVRLALRESDLHAVRGSLVFRSHETVEISEIQDASPASPTPAELVAESPGGSRGSAKPAEEPIGPDEELQVWAALRRIDADLGEQIAVERDAASNAVVVTALGLSQHRRRALEEALSGLPRVQLRFREPQQVREPSRSLPTENVNQRPFQLHLESQFGSRSAAEEFTDRILQASESSLIRAHAVRALGERFTPEIEAQLTGQSRALLSSLLSEHFSELASSSRRILRDARQIGAAETQAPELPAEAWQTHARSLVTAVERVDQTLTRLLTIEGSANAQQDLILDLGSALSRMEAEIRAAEPALRGKR